MSGVTNEQFEQGAVVDVVVVDEIATGRGAHGHVVDLAR
jgi:hypothetical protein